MNYRFLLKKLLPFKIRCQKYSSHSTDVLQTFLEQFLERSISFIDNYHISKYQPFSEGVTSLSYGLANLVSFFPVVIYSTQNSLSVYDQIYIGVFGFICSFLNNNNSFSYCVRLNDSCLVGWTMNCMTHHVSSSSYNVTKFYVYYYRTSSQLWYLHTSSPIWTLH